MTTAARAILLAHVSEAVWQAQIKTWAERGGWHFFHITNCEHYRRNKAGFPDCVLIRGTVLMVAELKKESGKTTPEQEAWLAAFRLAGIQAFVWRPSDADEVERLLTGGGNAPSFAPNSPSNSVQRSRKMDPNNPIKRGRDAGNVRPRGHQGS